MNLPVRVYTVCFLFTSSLSDVLLIEKNRTAFKGMYNGVGGKVEPADRSIRDAAIRELEEEAAVDPENLYDFQWVGTTVLPWDCTDDSGTIAVLHFFCGVVDQSGVRQMTDERLRWFRVANVLQTIDGSNGSCRFAGEGDVQYFIRQSIRLLTGDDKPIEDCPRIAL